MDIINFNFELVMLNRTILFPLYFKKQQGFKKC